LDPVPEPLPEAEPKPVPKVPKTTPEPKPEPVKPRNKGDGKAALKAYGRGVHASMESHKRYPIAARKLGLEGDVIVKVKIDRQGNLVGRPTIARSCGHEVLDNEALRMVEKAAPFAGLPEAFEKDTATLKLPVRFRLKAK
jgi:protein TonB